MATRSFISIKHKDNTYSGVYCHWDGGPDWNGKILKEDYQDRTKVVELIDGGDISSLKTRSTWDSESLYDKDDNIVSDENGFMMYKNDREPQPLYYYERGDVDVDPKHFKTYKQMYKYANDCCCEFLYVYEDGEVDQPKWSYCGVN